MTKKKNVHVVPRENGWAVIKEGNKKASALAETKKEALALGVEVGKKEQSELLVHNKDGKIGEHRSYGNDQCPPKDKK